MSALDRPVNVRTPMHEPWSFVDVRPADVLAALDQEQRQEVWDVAYYAAKSWAKDAAADIADAVVDHLCGAHASGEERAR